MLGHIRKPAGKICAYNKWVVKGVKLWHINSTLRNLTNALILNLNLYGLRRCLKPSRRPSNSGSGWTVGKPVGVMSTQHTRVTVPFCVFCIISGVCKVPTVLGLDIHTYLYTWTFPYASASPRPTRCSEAESLCTTHSA